MRGLALMDQSWKRWLPRLEKLLPAVFFLFVFFLYYSLLSDPYFTDEQDVFYGAYHVIKGQDIYKSFLSQHMPFSYYLAAPVALLGARTVFQFRLGIYLLLSLLWTAVFLRHRRVFHPLALFAMPPLYLTVLKNLYMGTTMISDHWQGIGLVLILLELVRYLDHREISLSCALMVALGILLSFGSSFASAYSLFCFFLGMVFLQIQDIRRCRQAGSAEIKGKRLKENLRLVLLCLLPFILLLGWYGFTGNIANFISGAYEIVTQVYSKYTGGLGSDPVAVVWETVLHFGEHLANTVRALPAAPWPNLLYLLCAVGMALYSFLIGRKSPIVGVLIFLACVYGGLRGFEGFHALPYYAQTTACLALLLSMGLEKRRSLSWPIRLAAGLSLGAAFVLMMGDFVIWAGYNLLYPQILLDRTLRCEERILDLLTDPEEIVFPCNAPVNSLDVMDLELVPKEASGAISYPYFYETWGDRMMASIQDQPHVVLYDGNESIWGYVFREYAPDFDAYMTEHYVRLPQAETIWVSRDFLPEAEKRLSEAGYGNKVVSNTADTTRNHPVKYFAGGSVEVVFTAENSQLTAIRFCGACFHRRSRPLLRIRILEANTRLPAAEGTMEAGEIADNLFSRCPISASLTPGKSYVAELTVESIGGKGDMEFYFTPEDQLSFAAEYLSEI